ncbi:hypothetical protein M406DRAFT_220629, partial [Cryphonectria parasitica EP155]
DDLLTDEYVADLLAKEAGDCSLKYSTMGMEAYTTSPTNKLKPNTRFLRNIIKGTNRHNNALAAKELSESQARLRDLADAKEEKRKKYTPSASEIRGRQLGNIAALLSGKTDEDARRLADMEAASRRQREKKEKHDKRRRSLERYSVTRRRGRRSEGGDEDNTYCRRNSSSEDERGVGESSRKKRHRERSRSPKEGPRTHRHRSPTRRKRRDDIAEETPDRPSHRHSKSTGKPTRSKQANDNDDDGNAESDPLEDLIGPAPPPTVLPRGRGALKGSSGMDSRFTPEYDPRSDLQADNDSPDSWDTAVEAFRGRAKMRQQGADRLRQAGFTEDEVKRWEKGGEKTIDDVQWAKKGEKRAWDQGKD